MRTVRVRGLCWVRLFRELPDTWFHCVSRSRVLELLSVLIGAMPDLSPKH